MIGANIIDTLFCADEYALGTFCSVVHLLSTILFDAFFGGRVGWTMSFATVSVDWTELEALGLILGGGRKIGGLSGHI